MDIMMQKSVDPCNNNDLEIIDVLDTNLENTEEIESVTKK